MSGVEDPDSKFLDLKEITGVKNVELSEVSLLFKFRHLGVERPPIFLEGVDIDFSLIDSKLET